MLPTVGGRVTRALTVLLFLAIAAFSSVLCWALPRQDRLARERAPRLLMADGTVNSTRVRKVVTRKRGYTSWNMETSYSFEVDERPVHGRRFNLDESSRELSFDFEDEAEALRARYPEGARVTVWYDPRDPWDSGLDPSWTPVAGYALPAAAVAALSLLVAVLGARSTLREARRQPLAASRRPLRALRVLLGAVAAARVLEAETSVGIHFGTFPQADDGIDEPAATLRRPGERRGARSAGRAVGSARPAPARQGFVRPRENVHSTCSVPP